MSRSNLTDVEVYLHHETERAVLVSLAGNRVNAVWLPKSAVEVAPHPSGNSHFRTLTLPIPLATDKKLV